jgi:hypothetical protein
LQLFSPASRPTPKRDPAPKRDIVTRWGGEAAIMSNGYVAVPVQFLMNYAAMKPYCLTVPEAMFVVQVMAFKWDEKAPFPGYKKVAARMGISEAYARKLARSLEGKGFLRRVARVGSTNAFDFQPLFEKLLKHAKTEGQASDAVTPEAAA